jgi:hypothetical protein
MFHQPLPVKTFPHAPLIFHVPQFKSRLVVHAPEYTSASSATDESTVAIWNVLTRQAADMGRQAVLALTTLESVLTGKPGEGVPTVTSNPPPILTLDEEG